MLSRIEPYYGKNVVLFPYGRKIHRVPLGDAIKTGLKPVEKSDVLRNAYTTPVKVQIQPTNHCNLLCKGCYASSGIAFPGELTIDNLKELLIKLRDWGVLQIEWAGGEVFTKKGYPVLVEFAKKLGFQQSLLTNGIYFGTGSPETLESRALWAWKYFHTIQISIDGYADSFDNHVGKKSWDKMDVALDYLSRFKSSEKLFTIATVLTENSEPYLEAIAKFVSGRVDSWRMGQEVKNGRSVTDHLSASKFLDSSWEKRSTLANAANPTPITHPYDKSSMLSDSRPMEFIVDRGARDFMYIDALGKAYVFPFYAGLSDYCGGSVLFDDLDQIWRSQEFENYRIMTREGTDCEGCDKICCMWSKYHFLGFEKDLESAIPALHPGCPRK